MTENIVSGKKYRILTDAANDVWDRISFWNKASDIEYNDGSTAENNRPVNILKRSTAYALGDVAYANTAPTWVMLKCTTAGTTAASAPAAYASISAVGVVITDGTAQFTVYDIRPSGTMSNSAFQVPAMSLVNSLNSELTANGNQFYFDYQDGKYGYNTDASRAAASFVPFGGSSSDVFLFAHVTGSGGYYPTAFVIFTPYETKYKHETVVTSSQYTQNYISAQIDNNSSHTITIGSTLGLNRIHVTPTINGSISIDNRNTWTLVSANTDFYPPSDSYNFFVFRPI